MGLQNQDVTMSEDISLQRQQLAQAFNQDADPLKKFEPTFEETGIDPFSLFTEEIVKNRDLSKTRYNAYDRAIRQWKKYMHEEGRHAACPKTDHVMSFAEYLFEGRGNSKDSTMDKLRILRNAYEYWQAEPEFPHPHDYNPFDSAINKLHFEETEKKKPPYLETDELREFVLSETDIRGRVWIVMQLKLGLRASELCNIKLSEIVLSDDNTEVTDHYDEIGSTPHIRDEIENAVYIPHERERNKSKRPRILPLDDELRKLLVQYLLIRPDNGSEWLFLSKTDHSQLDYEMVTDEWKSVFQPEYTETDDHRGITSHYGRHYFTTYWIVHQDWNRELVKYMRGDRFANSKDATAIDNYIHTYFEDIEQRYRDEIFKLKLDMKF